jgi:uncharacterized protein (TIRG00374 family)
LDVQKILKNVLIALVIGLAIVNIIGIFFAKQDPITALKNYPFKAIVVLILLMVSDYSSQAIRTMIVVRSLGYKITFFQSLENFFLTVFFSLVTPMSIGGQPFQIYHLTKLGIPSHEATNISLTRMFEGVFITFTIDIMMLKIILRVLKGTLGLSVIMVGFFVTFGITIAGLLTFTNRDLLFAIFKFFSRITKSKKLEERERKALEWLDMMTKSTRELFRKNYWTLIVDFILGLLISLIPSFMIKYAIEVVSARNVPLSIVWGVVNMLNTIVFYIPTPGSSGGVEGFYQLVFSHIYEPKAVMTGIFVIRLVTYYLIVLLGILLMWKFAGFREEVSHVDGIEHENEQAQSTVDDNK